MTAKEKELAKAYKKYIHFLENEYDVVFTLAYVHGYNCSESKIELGEQLRKEIQELEDDCGILNEYNLENIFNPKTCG